jgi:hypothetical protein
MHRNRSSGASRTTPVITLALALVALGVACAEPDPTFGDPGGILNRSLPNETTGGGGADGPFAGTNATAPTKTLKTAHGTVGPAPADYIDCMTCHKEGVNSQGAPSFSYGGRINDGATPVAGAEVIVLQGTTKIGPVKSDADGFFWSPGTALKDGAVTYVRKVGGTPKKMGGTLTAATGGGCNAAKCHAENGTSGKISI